MSQSHCEQLNTVIIFINITKKSAEKVKNFHFSFIIILVGNQFDSLRFEENINTSEMKEIYKNLNKQMLRW